MEALVTNVVEALPAEVQTMFVEVIGERDAALLSSLRTQTEPTREERHTVEDLLSDEMSKHLGPDYEPTDRGRAIDDAIGAFLTRWPIEPE